MANENVKNAKKVLHSTKLSDFEKGSQLGRALGLETIDTKNLEQSWLKWQEEQEKEKAKLKTKRKRRSKRRNSRTRTKRGKKKK